MLVEGYCRCSATHVALLKLTPIVGKGCLHLDGGLEGREKAVGVCGGSLSSPVLNYLGRRIDRVLFITFFRKKPEVKSGAASCLPWMC